MAGRLNAALSALSGLSRFLIPAWCAQAARRRVRAAMGAPAFQLGTTALILANFAVSIAQSEAQVRHPSVSVTRIDR